MQLFIRFSKLSCGHWFGYRVLSFGERILFRVLSLGQRVLSVLKGVLSLLILIIYHVRESPLIIVLSILFGLLSPLPG